MHGSRSFITMAFITSLILPGSAFATVMLDLSSNNTDFSGPFDSGANFFSDPAGLGWDLTINGFNSSGPSAPTTDPFGMGVAGGGLDSGDSLMFDFSPMAMLEGFTVKNGANDSVLYIAVGTPGIVMSEMLPNAGAGGGNYFVDVASAADSLTIMNTGSGPGSGYRISSLSFADASVPEPAVIGLLSIGLLGMGAAKRLKKSA